MGDRGNIVVRGHRFGDKRDPAVFLYTHWSGSDLPETLANALQSREAKSRGADGSYLTRIIFDRMVAAGGGSMGDETGFGISAYLTDGNGTLLVVTPSDGDGVTVQVVPEGTNVNDDDEMAQYPAFTADEYSARAGSSV